MVINVNTTNGLERQNKSFKYSYLERKKSLSLSGMVTILVTEYLRNMQRRYGKSTIHRLILPKGVYPFRYFLSPMRIPNLLMHVFIMLSPFVICSCIYAFCLRIAIRHSMHIPGICIEV